MPGKENNNKLNIQVSGQVERALLIITTAGSAIFDKE